MEGEREIGHLWAGGSDSVWQGHYPLKIVHGGEEIKSLVGLGAKCTVKGDTEARKEDEQDRAPTVTLTLVCIQEEVTQVKADD